VEIVAQEIEEGVLGEIKTLEAEEVLVEAKVQRKCTRQCALIVEMIVKFHLSRQGTDQFTAENALAATRSFKLTFLNIIFLFHSSFTVIMKSITLKLFQSQ
jgi:hypothetical protein